MDNDNYHRSYYQFILFISMFAIVTGCAAKKHVVVEGDYNCINVGHLESAGITDKFIRDSIQGHIIEIDSRGNYRPIAFHVSQLSKGGRFSSKSKLCRHSNGPSEALERQPNKIEDFARQIRKQWTKDEQTEVVFVIHGGMVPFSTGLEEALMLNKAIAADDERRHQKRYPIFVNWRSGGLDAYWEQLTEIRQGARRPALARASAPVKIVSDVGRGIFDMPSFAFLEGARLWNTQSDDYNRCYKEQKNVICPAPGTISQGFLSETWEYSQYFLKTPFRIATAPFIHGMGRSAWENMLRRTRNTIVQEPKGNKPVNGAVKTLMEKLFVRKQDSTAGALTKSCDNHAQISFLAHSMGTIIASDLIGRFPECTYKDVVFMGAAVSIREFSEKVIPVLSKQKNTMRFYNLSLFPKLEAREMSAGGLVPSGSLLEWIDEVFTPPTTKFDRTFGKWSNVRDVYFHFPEELKDNMSFEVFGRANGEPQKHGEFNDIDKCFWQQSYLQSGVTEKTWKKHYCDCRKFLTKKNLLPIGTKDNNSLNQYCSNIP